MTRGGAPAQSPSELQQVCTPLSLIFLICERGTIHSCLLCSPEPQGLEGIQGDYAQPPLSLHPEAPGNRRHQTAPLPALHPCCVFHQSTLTPSLQDKVLDLQVAERPSQIMAGPLLLFLLTLLTFSYHPNSYLISYFVFVLLHETIPFLSQSLLYLQCPAQCLAYIK